MAVLHPQSNHVSGQPESDLEVVDTEQSRGQCSSLERERTCGYRVRL